MAQQGIHMTHLGVRVTSACNLNCRHCADLVPHEENAMYSFEEIKEDLGRVLAVIDGIEELLIIGGETFLYPDLKDVIEHCAMQEKIDTICITTNGTLIPREEVLEALSQYRVRVNVSGYSEMVAPKRKELIQILQNANVPVNDMSNGGWATMGGFEKRNRTEEELKAVFQSCSMAYCITLVKGGNIVFCSRQLAAVDTELYPTPPEYEYVNVRKSRDLRQDLLNFYSLEYISTCDYCDGISCATKFLVPKAVQILPKEEYLRLWGLYRKWEYAGFKADNNLLAITQELINDTNLYLEDTTECNIFLSALEKASEEASDEKVQALQEAIFLLLNRLADDYTYRLSDEIPFKRMGEQRQNLPNVISVGLREKDKENEYDILVSTDELLDACDQAYPLDAFAIGRLQLLCQFYRLQTEEIRCLISGLSYTDFGIIAGKICGGSCVKIHCSGQDMFYQIAYARRALELCDTIRTIVFPMAYYQGFYDMSADDAPLHEGFVSRVNIPLLGVRHNYRKEVYEDGYCDPRPIWQVYNRSIHMKALRDYLDEQCLNHMKQNGIQQEWPAMGGLKIDFHLLKGEEKRKSAKITADLNERILKTDPSGAETKRCLVDFLDEMKGRDIQVLIFVPPMTKALFEAHSPELRKKFYEVYGGLFEEYDFVKFRDWSLPAGFTDADFLDFEHLGETGAEKLTEMIIDECPGL